ncbi:MAG: phosphate/phosphite/phosphonate ABC transporter substrate-binding protein [Alphaproteobacteria bacterium]
MPLAMNARMYSVTPAAEAAWRSLLEHVADDAGIPLDYVPYPAPQPLEALWERDDLAMVFMCGYPFARLYPHAQPIAAPVLALPWAEGRPVYRSDFVVRADSPHRRLEDTFGGRLAWTVEHSHSGFNAARHHLLAFRDGERPRLYGSAVGPLVTARRIVDAVTAGDADVGPLDAWFHALLRRWAPDAVSGLRVVASTVTAPIPLLVAAPGIDPALVARLRDALTAAHARPWFRAVAEPLLVERFVAVGRTDYAPLLAMADAAIGAGYAMPG